MEHAASSWVRYLVVWLALLGLTALTFGLSFAHLGSTDVAVALVIASAKTTLVALFFMHLAEERFSVAMLPVLAVLLFVLLVTLVAVDVATRRTFPRGPSPNLGELPALSD
jgi:cytochrome c oxidase subunit 4